MVYCGSCGTKYEDGMRFCPSCGAPTGSKQGAYSQAGQSTVYQTPLANGAPAKDDIRDAQDNKAMAILAYFGPLVLVPIFAAKESNFARYHANQGLVLCIAAILYGIVYAILSSITILISLGAGLVITFILGLVFWVFGIFSIIGIVRACKGEKKPLPLIGGITILK